MSENLRQETRLPRSETLFIEVRSGYQERSQILLCSSADVSANGVSAHIDDALPLDAIYQLCVQLQDAQERLYLAVQVKWLRPDEAGAGFYVGLEVLESDGTDVDKWKLHIADLLQA
ncbi:MAG: PilZ domain-containing protein [Pseudomonadales bacterium]|nr:PilZ domain-containing protein [Pseudomonadales bacterium]